MLAGDIVNYLSEIGTDNRRIAVEYVNPSITLALIQRGLEVVDGVKISEQARVIKSTDEIAYMKWAIGVAELGIAEVKEALHPGDSELQLWGFLTTPILPTMETGMMAVCWLPAQVLIHGYKRLQAGKSEQAI